MIIGKNSKVKESYFIGIGAYTYMTAMSFRFIDIFTSKVSYIENEYLGKNGKELSLLTH
jgi:hypothetical protein